MDASARLTLQPNVDEFTLRRQTTLNRKAGWMDWLPPACTLTRVALVGGGPSLHEQVATLASLRAQGVTVVALNGAHQWCLDNGIFPDFQIIMDARPHNARFTAKPTAGTRYLIAEHVHPEVLQHLRHRSLSTYLWSVADIHGGSTVMLCAPQLLQCYGAQEFHFFGFDSCLRGTSHHAYPQAENDGEEVLLIPVQEQVFYCTAWMVQQAEEFLEMQARLGQVTVYGNGMIAALLSED